MTKTTSLPLLSILAAFAVQACAAPTSEDASSDPMTPAAVENEGANDSNPAAGLAGKYGERPADMFAGVEQPSAAQMNAGEEIHAQLFVASRKQTYDVLAYSFGVANSSKIDATGAKVAALPSLSEVQLMIAKKDGLPSLSKDLFTGKPIGNVVLRQRDAYGKYIDVATFETAIVVNASASANDGVSESIALGVQALEVRQGSGWVRVSAIGDAPTCSSPCPCETEAGQIGPYVQTLSSTLPIAKGAKRVESLSVSISNPIVQSATLGGLAASRAHLDGMSVSSAFETSGMCALYKMADVKPIPSLKLGVAASSSTSKEPRESTTWEACVANVKSVSFTSRFDAMAQSIELDAGGLVRTDREWSPTTNALSSSTTTGWSFVKNSPMTSCADTL